MTLSGNVGETRADGLSYVLIPLLVDDPLRVSVLNTLKNAIEMS